VVNIQLNIFFILLIKWEIRPHHTRLPFPKMRDARSYSYNTLGSSFFASSFIRIPWHGCPRVTQMQGGAGNG
jgi:hypothetical protein